MTFRGMSIDEELLVKPPCKLTSITATPPLNVEIVVDSPDAETRLIGMQEPSNKSVIRIGEARLMLTPGDLSEKDTPSSALSYAARFYLWFYGARSCAAMLFTKTNY